MVSILQIEAFVHGSPRCHDRLVEDASMYRVRDYRGLASPSGFPGERLAPAAGA
jgi:hypothetical protein